MQLEIIPREALPCRLLTFTINGKEADMEEFGYCSSYGDVDAYECSNIFTPFEIPDHDILKKYEISKGEYREICEKLRDKLRVTDCGWCS
jgi:hypothetical protein